MGCGRPLCRRDNGPSSGNPGHPTGQVCAAQVEVRPHNAEWSPGRASHHQISPIKCGLQPIMTAQGRIRGRMPILLSLSAAGRSNPGNPGSSGPIARSGSVAPRSVAPSLQDPEEWSILARDKRPFLIFTWPTQEFLTRMYRVWSTIKRRARSYSHPRATDSAWRRDSGGPPLCSILPRSLLEPPQATLITRWFVKAPDRTFVSLRSPTAITATLIAAPHACTRTIHGFRLTAEIGWAGLLRLAPRRKSRPLSTQAEQGYLRLRHGPRRSSTGERTAGSVMLHGSAPTSVSVAHDGDGLKPGAQSPAIHHNADRNQG